LVHELPEPQLLKVGNSSTFEIAEIDDIVDMA